MGVTIRQNTLFLSDENGNLVPVGMFGAGVKESIKSIDEYAANVKNEIIAEAETAKNAITEKTDEQVDRIPEVNAIAENVKQIDSTFAPPIVCSKSGNVITIDDSADKPLRSIAVYGKTAQDGTPSEDAPVEMHSVGDAGEVTVSVLAGLPEGGTEQITIIRQPRDVTVAVNSTVTFSVFAIGYGLTYQWEYMPTTSMTWRNNTLPGNDTDTLTFSAKAYHDGYKYRCLITDASGNTVRTDEVTLTIGEISGSSDDAADTQDAAISIADGLRGVPAISDGNYTDENGQQWITDTVEYDAETGTAQFVRRVVSVTFDGSTDENWVKGGSGSYFAIKLSGKSNTSHGLCTHYQGIAINAGENNVGFTAATDKDYIRFRPTDYADMTVDTWREQLNASPVTVLYALSDPEITQIVGDELVAIKSLRCRHPSTTVYNDAFARSTVQYIADTKTYIDNRIDQAIKAYASQ